MKYMGFIAFLGAAIVVMSMANVAIMHGFQLLGNKTRTRKEARFAAGVIGAGLVVLVGVAVSYGRVSHDVGAGVALLVASVAVLAFSLARAGKRQSKVSARERVSVAVAGSPGLGGLGREDAS